MRPFGGSGAVVCIPNSTCFEVNLPGAEPGIVCPRAVREQTVPAKIPLMYRSSVAFTLCSRHARHFLTSCIGDSSGHFSCSQGAVGGGNYLSVFGCCIIGCAATCDGMTGVMDPPLPLACMLGSRSRQMEEHFAFHSK